ncbi:hypothetical protein Phum_PHUM417050 [Pediculus humanus corporis]|uniref:BED-type domain-containing protein n=1 Tax=Pediculus humanus subsp. corporis TaxID=121224 RepID=E0VSD0_PEDHC|nr:uncharacterized protein Phum_PHUM417050 [Pediculus humanus corporis]EEB16286.1 hypothetical protein Phum_PHUM417050 [Pediculus humanus corporis]
MNNNNNNKSTISPYLCTRTFPNDYYYLKKKTNKLKFFFFFFSISDPLKRLNLLFNSKKSNPVWDYFQLDGDKAICRLCNKRLAYKNHMYLTSLSNHLASKRYGHRQHYMEYVTKKNELIRETDMFNNIILKMGNRTFDSSDFYNFKYMYKNFICDK